MHGRYASLHDMSATPPINNDSYVINRHPNLIGSTSTSIFVGDLSITCTEYELQDLISNYIDVNHISQIIIKKCKITGSSLCYGFVTLTCLNS